MLEETAPESPRPPVATIATIGQHDGQSVTLQGWLYNLRESGSFCFPSFAMEPDRSRAWRM